jgi:restriction system protein
MEYHFAPDFLNLFVETISRLNRSKKDLLLFFRGAGVIYRL